MNGIQAGDLVILIRTHGCGDGPGPCVGHIFTVTNIEYKPTICPTCNKIETEWSAWGLEKYLTPLSWLKKIPPLNELETTEQEEKLTA